MIELERVGFLPTNVYTPQFADAVAEMRQSSPEWFAWPADTEHPTIPAPGKTVVWDLIGELSGAVEWTRRDGRTFARWTAF